MSRSPSLRSASLRTGYRCLLGTLLCWRERDQGCANDNEGSHAQQFSAWNQICGMPEPPSARRGQNLTMPRTQSGCDLPMGHGLPTARKCRV